MEKYYIWHKMFFSFHCSRFLKCIIFFTIPKWILDQKTNPFEDCQNQSQVKNESFRGLSRPKWRRVNFSRIRSQVQNESFQKLLGPKRDVPNFVRNRSYEESQDQNGCTKFRAENILDPRSKMNPLALEPKK